ncbi:MAG: hypothetical protein ACUZ77_00405 [Candidatus Brocadiales bacterium]
MEKYFTVLLAILCSVSIPCLTYGSPQLGETREFWTWDLHVMPPKDVQIKATCRGIGKNIYIFVADTEWLVRVNQQDIDKIIETFDHSTPATSLDPSKGIYDIVTGVFGSPPDVDNDPKIYFLISQLSEYKGHTFDGYFRYLDQLDVEYSNRHDILHLDSDHPSNDYHIAVIAHEFHHLIQWSYDKDEASWISESMAEVSMVICGYYTDKPKASAYLGYTNRPLVEKLHADYGACLLWGVYLFDRFGGTFLSSLMKEEANGIEGFECALKTTNIEKNFQEIFGDWMTANYLNNARVNKGKYAYKSISLPRPSPYQQFSGMPVSGTGDVKGFGVNYIRFSGLNAGDNVVQISFTADSYKDFLIRAIKINSTDMSKSNVEQITLLSPTTNFYIRNSMDTSPPPLPSNKRGLRGVLRGEKNGGFDEIVLAISAMEKTDTPLSYSFSASFVSE